MVLSDLAILEARQRGDLLIEPFVRANLNSSSYDVTLGEWYYREQHPASSGAGAPLYNIYDEHEVKRVWGEPQQAQPLPEGAALTNIPASARVILLKPGETILAHTQEFIGGLKDITTKMQARSSMGRNFIEVCKCAGFGDIGYVSRWTMEITNNSQHYTIPLVVGRRLAQIVFFQTPPAQQIYQSKYQECTAAQVQQRWQPSDMLPKLYLERELRPAAQASACDAECDCC
jgi:dCTP deaminase